MRFGQGDIAALRILPSVPVALGFAFFGVMIWAGLHPPSQEEVLPPQVKAQIEEKPGSTSTPLPRERDEGLWGGDEIRC